MKPGGIARLVTGALLTSAAWIASAATANPEPWQLNLTRGATPTSQQIYHLHMAGFWTCVVIGVVVFTAMIIAMVRFRRSKGAIAETWNHNTRLEVVWTIIPVLILVGLAWPSTRVLMHMADTTNAEMTVKVTGYQWKWRYDYIDYQGRTVDKVGFMSKLDFDSDRTRQRGSGLDPQDVRDEEGFASYLLNVDKPLVLPTGIKIRFVITAEDVIHSWWVPSLGYKIDAIPGIVNDSWALIEKPGLYRGQCAELCGQDHGFMPVVIKAVTPAEFEQWLAAQEDESSLQRAARTAQADTATATPRG